MPPPQYNCITNSRLFIMYELMPGFGTKQYSIYSIWGTHTYFVIENVLTQGWIQDFRKNLINCTKMLHNW